MPKVKTNSSAKKRFKITGTGKVVYKHAGKRHNLGKKSQTRIRNLRKSGVMAEGFADKVRLIYCPNGLK
jgi:large subunit ribosomal protein L35